MSITFTYCQEGSRDYVKVVADGEDHNGDNARVIEAITPHDLLRAAADLLDQCPYYKDFFDKRLLG